MATKQTNDKVVLKKLVSGAKSNTAASGVEAGTAITNNLADYFNKTLSTLRATGKTLEAIRTLARVHGDVSAAVAATVRLADTEFYTRVYSADHQLSPEGSDLLRSVLVRMDNTYDYGQGYDDRMPLSGVKTSLLRSLPLTGACALELVLDQQRLPYRLQPVSVETLKFKTTSKKLGTSYKIIPYQQGTDGDIELDVPTFFYASLDQDLTSAYSFSPLEPSINTSFFHAETVDDIRRVVKRSGHSRLVVRLITEKVLDSAPMEIKSDPTKLTNWVENTRAAVQKEIESLSPEAALVFFDTIEAEYLNSEIGASADYKPLMEMIDAVLATALKTPAAVVGKRTSGGSQNTSSTESLLFIKTAEGLHGPAASVLSRALTLALRLYGFDGYVTCEFASIDLRPKVELEAFKSMEQARILEQLSLGFISDQEAAELLHTGPRSPNAPELSGSMFYNGNSGGDSEPPSPNGDPARRAMTTDTPSSSGGKDNSQR